MTQPAETVDKLKQQMFQAAVANKDNPLGHRILDAHFAALRELIEQVIDTTKPVYYVKGKTDIETADKFKEVDRYCEIREELRVEQKAALDLLFGGERE